MTMRTAKQLRILVKIHKETEDINVQCNG